MSGFGGFGSPPAPPPVAFGGSNNTGTGFAFGTSQPFGGATTTTTPAMGAAANPFGGAHHTTTATPLSGFAPAATAATTTTSSFGQPPAQQQQQSPPAPVGGSMTFGSSPNVAFGTAAAPANNTTTFGGGGMTFGSSGNTAATGAPAGGFGFGGSTASGGSAGNTMGTTAPFGGGFGTAAAAAPMTTTTTTAGPFGAPAPPNQGGMFFGGASAPAAQPFGQQPPFGAATTTTTTTANHPFGSATSAAAGGASAPMSFGMSSTVVSAGTTGDSEMGGYSTSTTTTTSFTPFGTPQPQSGSPMYQPASDNEDMTDDNNNNNNFAQQPQQQQQGASNLPFGTPSSTTSTSSSSTWPPPAAASATTTVPSRGGSSLSPIPEDNPMGEPADASTSDPADQTQSAGAGNDNKKEDAKLKSLKAKIEEKKKRLQEQKRRKQQQQQSSGNDEGQATSTLSATAPSFVPKVNEATRAALPADLRGAAGMPSSSSTVATSATGDSKNRKVLQDAKSLVGTCPHMCPDEELLRREREGDVQMLELPRPGGLHPAGWTLRDTAVKRFRRSAADYKLDVPEWVRPPMVLERTVAYLEEWVMERDRQGPDPRFPGTNGGSAPPPLDVYQFIWDRTRMIRKDFILQNYVGTGGLCNAVAVRCHERIARWHAMCEHQLCHLSDFVQMQSQQNIQELGQTMKTLNQYYDDAKHRSVVVEQGNEDGNTVHGCSSDIVQGPNPVDYDGSAMQNVSQPSRLIGLKGTGHGTAEPEMRGMYILLTMDNDGGMEVLKYAARLFRERPDVYHSKPVQLAMRIYKAKKEYNYARFFSILKSPSTPYLFACIMFKHVEFMRRIAFRIMAKTFGARNRETQEAHFDSYPLAQLQRLLCFESLDEARDACRHYHICVVKEAPEGGNALVETIYWRRQSFREAKDPDKGTTIPLVPQKMVQTIEGKRRGATRLAVCRGECSGEGASLATAAGAAVANEHAGSLQQGGGQAADRAAAALLAMQQKERERLERQAQKEEAEEKARREEALRRQEMERQRLAEEQRIRAEKEAEKRRQEQEQRAREEQERVLREQKRIQMEREQEEARKRAQEADRKRQEEERRRQEEVRRAAEAEEKKRREELERKQREEEERLLRKRQEEERKRRQQEEEERQRHEAERKRLEEEERRERKRKEAEELRIRQEWQARIDAAQKRLVLLRWLRRFPRHLQMIEQTEESLGQMDPTLQTSPVELDRALRTRATVRSSPTTTTNVDLRRIVERLLREPGGEMASSMAQGIATEFARWNHVRKPSGGRGGHNTLLYKVAVMTPQSTNLRTQSLGNLIHAWIRTRLEYGRVHRANGPDDTAQVRLVVVNGNTMSHAVACNVALIVLPPPWSSQVDARAGPSDQETLASLALRVDDEIPRVVLSLAGQQLDEMGRTLADSLAGSFDNICVIHNTCLSEDAVDNALWSSCESMVATVVGQPPVTIQRISVLGLCFMCIGKVIWQDRILERRDDILSHAVAALDVMEEELRDAKARLEKCDWSWPAPEFAAASNDNGKSFVVEDYFAPGVHLPLDWVSGLAGEELSAAIARVKALLEGSFPQVIDRILDAAPDAVRRECERMLHDRFFKRCLERALLWRRGKCRGDDDDEEMEHVILPGDVLERVVRGTARRSRGYEEHCTTTTSEWEQSGDLPSPPERGAQAEAEFEETIDLPPDETPRADFSVAASSKRSRPDPPLAAKESSSPRSRVAIVRKKQRLRTRSSQEPVRKKKRRRAVPPPRPSNGQPGVYELFGSALLRESRQGCHGGQGTPVHASGGRPKTR